jgi:HEAT repeat protein
MRQRNSSKKQMKTARLSGRELKRKVLALLQSDDFDRRLNDLCQWPARQVINPLFSFLLSSDEQTRWRAITAMGEVVAHLAETDMESARIIMRRLMWSLNDESGGIGWGAPEVMGEIIASHGGLAQEYVRVLISYIREDGNFLEYEPLQRGALWAVGRVAQSRSDLVQDALPHLLPYLASTDASVRGLAAWTVGLLGAEGARPPLEALVEDKAEISLYLDRQLVRRSVGSLAKEALASTKRHARDEEVSPQVPGG